MFWGENIIEKVEGRFEKKIASQDAILIRDEKTASGRVHVGSMRGVAIHGVVAEMLQSKNINCRYLYEINDFDPMDGLPVYLDQDVFLPYMGKPLCAIFENMWDARQCFHVVYNCRTSKKARNGWKRRFESG